MWRQLTALQKATLVAVALGAVAAIAFLTQWAPQPEYAAAFTGLSESDAAAVVARLKEQKIPYQLSEGGATVRVPSDKVYEVRLQLASQGLPKGGTVGFELFDKLSFGLTDFAQRLNFQRALEGELSRTIGRISGVEEARVHVALPQNELFLEKEKLPTASVVLKLRPGFEMDGRQVRGITNLVSRGVEGLKPENVTVLDGDGVMLSDQDDAAGGAGRTGAQRDAQRAYERALQRDLQGMLEQVLGSRKAVVRASATLDWDQRETSSETYSPNGKEVQVRSSRELVERSSAPLGDGWSSSGVPSYPLDPRSPAGRTSPSAAATPTAVPEGAPRAAEAVAPSSQPGYERREVLNNYEVSKQVERTVKAPGVISRLSVSVMVDGRLDDETASTISRAVSAAAGLSTARGDSVVVAGLPFDRSASAAREQASQESAQRELYLAVGRGALAAISMLVVLLLVRSVIRGLTRGYREGSVRGVNAQGPQMVATAPARAALSEEERRPRLVQREVTEMAKNQPKLVAGILKTWLDER